MGFLLLFLEDGKTICSWVTEMPFEEDLPENMAAKELEEVHQFVFCVIFHFNPGHCFNSSRGSS